MDRPGIPDSRILVRIGRGAACWDGARALYCVDMLWSVPSQGGEKYHRGKQNLPLWRMELRDNRNAEKVD